MPQMMPMLWTLMLMSTMSIMLITIIFTYFLNHSFSMTPPSNYPQKFNEFTNWKWLW